MVDWFWLVLVNLISQKTKRTTRYWTLFFLFLSSALWLIATYFSLISPYFKYHWTHWTTSDRVYIATPLLNNTKRGDNMIDLQTQTIKLLFEQQLLNLTTKTILQNKEDTFDFQLSGGWIR